MSLNYDAQIQSWKEVRKSVQAINPYIAKKMDGIKGVDSFQAVVCKYPFGADIIDHGQFKMHIDNESLNFTKKNIPKDIFNVLNYNWRSIPFGMVSSNTIESHINHPSHIVPFRLLRPGKTFSLLTVFDDTKDSNFMTSLYSTKSGCKSLIFLPQITHALSNERVRRKYCINENHLRPKHSSQHWDFFNDIIQSSHFEHDWHSEIILFSHEFINSIQSTLGLRYSLLDDVWQQCSFRRNEVTHDFILSLYLTTLPLYLKNNKVVIETFKHIIKLIMQEVPGFIPATSNQAAPIEALTDMFFNIYKIRNNLPVFMVPDHYDLTHPIYYSLQHHTFFDEIPTSNNNRKTIQELMDVKVLLDGCIDFITNNKSGYDLTKTLLYKRLQSTSLHYYHPKGTRELKSDTSQIFERDERFSKIPVTASKLSLLHFPAHSRFFHGCIVIAPK